jgi:hypothetical protein
VEPDKDGEGSWVLRFEEMGLPSFRPLYLFLVRIPLDVLHEALCLRLEQQPEAEPSLLSVRQVRVGSNPYDVMIIIFFPLCSLSKKAKKC